MPTIPIRLDSESHVGRSEDGAVFLYLGQDAATMGTAKRKRCLRARERATRNRESNEDAHLWGTLGMADNSTPNWTGEISFSAIGNKDSKPDESSPVTVDEINLVRRSVPESGAHGRKVLERYISFSSAGFPELPKTFGEEDLPHIRLTLMLGQDEGAAVYYQMHPLNDHDNMESKEIALEYIQPQPTERTDCSERDRLTYLFPLRPSKRITGAGKKGLLKLGAKINERFVLKILTFKRENAESATVINRLLYHLWGHSHQLQSLQPSQNQFATIDGSEVKPDVPTLLLLHGTMSSANLAFQGLLDGDADSWLNKHLAGNKGPYAQILAFNHPTLSEDAADNAMALLDRLPRGFAFHQPVDLISHSRGGLLAKYLMLNTRQIPIRRGALAACANGVGYFTAGRHVSRALSALRALTPAGTTPVLGSILALAQHSGDAFLELPGANLMTPRSDRLTALLESPGHDAKPYAKFLPIAGNFDKSMVADRGFFRRYGERGLDALLKLILGPQHDWVVGTKEQMIVAPPNRPPGWRERIEHPGFILKARHSDYFPSLAARARMRRYFQE